MKKMRNNRRQWNFTIESVIGKGLENEPVNQKWILKDVIAHVYWYEKELLDALQKKSISESSFWNSDVETRNSMIFEKTQELTLEEIIIESNVIFERLLKEIEAINDDDLNSDTYIKRKEGTRVTHDFIGGLTFWHTEEHEDALVDLFDLEYSS